MKPDPETGTYLAKWRSDKAEQTYRELEDAAWQRATDSPPEAMDVSTHFGSTRVYRWAGSGPPVVFLHGMGDTSIRWVPYAEKLEELDVYAVDTMGDVGRSRPEIGFINFVEDYGSWLGETVDGLGLVRPHLVGESMGGYIALAYAISSGQSVGDGEPERIASTIAVDPAGVAKLHLIRFMAWGFGAMVASLSPEPIRKRLAHRLRHPLLLDKAATKLYGKGYQGHPPQIPPLPDFTDEQLSSITSPLHVLAAAESAAFDGENVVRRIKATVDGAEAQLLPDAGHALSMSHFDEILAAIRAAVAVDANP